MIKKYEKIKIRVEHFPYFTKTKRTLGNCTKIMISVKNEITLKSRSSKGGPQEGPKPIKTRTFEKQSLISLPEIRISAKITEFL